MQEVGKDKVLPEADAVPSEVRPLLRKPLRHLEGQGESLAAENKMLSVLTVGVQGSTVIRLYLCMIHMMRTASPLPKAYLSQWIRGRAPRILRGLVMSRGTTAWNNSVRVDADALRVLLFVPRACAFALSLCLVLCLCFISC